MIKNIFIFLGCIMLHHSMKSQINNEYFYYYKNEKKFLELNKEYILVYGQHKNDLEKIQVKNLNTSSDIGIDRYFNSYNGNTKKPKTSYLKEMQLQVITEKAYVNTLVNIKRRYPKLKITPYFKDKKGNRMGLTNYFYVQLKDGYSIDYLKRIARRHKAKIVEKYRYIPNCYILRTTKNSDNALTLSNKFYETKVFVFSEPNFAIAMPYSGQTDHIKTNKKVSLTSNIPSYYSSQWGLKNTGQYNGTPGVDIKVESAWNITKGSSNIKVAVVDDGVDMGHNDLANNILGVGYDAVTASAPSQVNGGHGTACAGIIGALDDNKGIVGVAPNTKIISLSNPPNINTITDQMKLATSINRAWNDENADIISNSWAYYGSSNTLIDQAITAALSQGRQGKGCIVIFATGNNDGSIVGYPASSNSKILAVGAINQCGKRKSKVNTECENDQNWGSNYGDELDIVAPGTMIYTTDVTGTGGYENGSYNSNFRGTSAAAPFVAGVAALILSVNPNLTVVEVNNIIEKTAQKLPSYSFINYPGRSNGTWNGEVGYGLVNAHAAVLMAQNYNCELNVTVTQHVNINQSDNKSAQNTITAQNTVYNGGTANYNAGTTVYLKPGFVVQSGGMFKGFIQGCVSNGSSSSLVNFSSSTIGNVVEMGSSKNKNFEQKEKSIKLYPNPTEDIIHIIGVTKVISWRLTDSFDKTMFSGNEMVRKINIKKLRRGMYFLKLHLDNNQIIVKKVLKN